MSTLVYMDGVFNLLWPISLFLGPEFCIVITELGGEGGVTSTLSPPSALDIGLSYKHTHIVGLVKTVSRDHYMMANFQKA